MRAGTRKPVRGTSEDGALRDGLLQDQVIDDDLTGAAPAVKVEESGHARASATHLKDDAIFSLAVHSGARS